MFAWLFDSILLMLHLEEPTESRAAGLQPLVNHSKRIHGYIHPCVQGAGSRTLEPIQAHQRVEALSKVTDMRRQRMASDGACCTFTCLDFDLHGMVMSKASNDPLNGWVALNG